MISYKEASRTILNNAFSLESDQMNIHDLDYHVLSEDIKADRDMPPFFKSAVDGYACYSPTEGQELEVLETISAGIAPQYEVKPGTASKIMTGAEVPRGADWIVMVENTEKKHTGKIYIHRTGSKSNIAEKGEDFRQGDIILKKGTIIKPQHIAILASIGSDWPLVKNKPQVNIITTGDELVEPGTTPDKNQIRNSNASQLKAQLKQIGVIPDYSGIIKDTKNTLRTTLSKSLKNYHITLITGGVSMGDYDFVPGMLKSLGVEILFHKIAMKPGKPTLFGRKDNHLVFGLPGNPVSSFLQTELLVKPLILKMMEAEYQPTEWKLPMGKDFPAKVSDRDSWKPVKVRDGKIYPVHYHGSGHIHALNEAEGFICIPVGSNGYQKDNIVHVRSI
jgi:molybdopterin molybdotransferase